MPNPTTTATDFVPQGAFSHSAVQKLLLADFNNLAASGKITPGQTGRYLITKATAAALTLAAPTQADTGKMKRIISITAAAHTITATGLFADGAGNVNVATFAAQIGASIDLIAVNKKWYVLRQQGITMS